MKIEDVIEDTLCETCEFGIKRKCAIGFRILNGDAEDLIKGEYGFWGLAAGIEHPEIAIAVLECKGYKALHSKEK
jgi:hypothetical protein